MNTVLYLVAQADNKIPYCEFFDSMVIMNEQELREFVDGERAQGHIAKENLDAHNIDETDDIYQVDISEIFGVLCDNDIYDEKYQYYISQQEVRIDEQDMYD